MTNMCLFFSFQEDANDNLDAGPNHFQPMVAVLCGHGKLLNKYLDENRRWVTDNDPKAICTKDKLEILEYCRKVRSISSIDFKLKLSNDS